jgi:outer membrane protein OmpA-like peptidoglycan-associated protein
VTALLWAALALAQEDTAARADVELFRPTGDHYGYTVTESAATLQNLQLGVGFWGMYAQDPLVFYAPDGTRLLAEEGKETGDAVIDQRSSVNLQVGLGVTKYFSFVLDAPVILWQEGFDPFRFGTEGTTDLFSSGMGDLRLRPKIVPLSLDDRIIGVAFIPTITVPTGRAKSFMGEGGATFEPVLAVEMADAPVHGREYRVRGAVNIGYRVRKPWNYLGLRLGNELIYRAALAAHPSPPVEIGAEIFGELSGGGALGNHALEAAFWLKLIPMDLVSITMGGSFGTLPGAGSPDMRFFFGGTLAPSFDPATLDRDKDGIPNKTDDCVNIPEDKDNFEDEDGCPEEDNDQDGLVDPEDRCPDDPEDYDEFEDDDGCPDPDNDRDKILDVDDDCPNKPENYNKFRDEDGCPDEKPPGDADGDGFLDPDDRCVYDPEDFDSFEDDDGCPEVDNDLDGILDPKDACPLIKEVYNGFEDEDGCPDEAPSRVIVEKKRIRITDRIYFEYNKADIKPLSFELLDEIAAVVNDHTELKAIRIEGHTDSDGDDAYNLRLSQSRAQAVLDYLVKGGVDRGRLDAAGFGETKPVDSNDTDEGKQNNRRVEFMIVDREE